MGKYWALVLLLAEEEEDDDDEEREVTKARMTISMLGFWQRVESETEEVAGVWP